MLMDLGIAGKVAIVTGGSHGIGRAVSEELGRNGCRVVVVARGQEQLDSTVDAIRSEGGEAIAVSADLTAFDCFPRMRSEEHTSELQSLMRISYAVFCLKKKSQE